MSFKDPVLNTFLAACIEMGQDAEEALKMLKESNLTILGLGVYGLTPDEIVNVPAYVQNHKKETIELLEKLRTKNKEIGMASSQVTGYTKMRKNWYPMAENEVGSAEKIGGGLAHRNMLSGVERAARRDKESIIREFLDEAKKEPQSKLAQIEENLEKAQAGQLPEKKKTQKAKAGE